MAGDQERLARLAEDAHDEWCMENEARDPWHSDAWAAVAARVLDSDVIKEIELAAERRGRRVGWDEGHDTCRQDIKDPRAPYSINPYDREASDG